MASCTGHLQLRDWLLSLLEVNSIPGLQWVDRDRQIFAIAWRHGSKKGWASDIDSKLFKEWAVYKKRYQPGNDDGNSKLWKSRFRCALNALTDVIELKTLSNTKGPNAKKIYQFLPKLYSRKSHKQKKDLYTVKGGNDFSSCITIEPPCIQDRKKISPPVVKRRQFDKPSPYFFEQNVGMSNMPGIFQNEEEEMDWLLYEAQRAMCKSWPDDVEENIKIEDFLTPKAII